MTEFSKGITPDSLPFGITQADGDLWFTEINTGKLGEITRKGQ